MAARLIYLGFAASPNKLMKTYTLVIEKGTEAWWGYFPDLPGCTTGGGTLEAVVANAVEALALYLEDTEAPPARTLAEILADSAVAGDLDGSELFAPVAYDAAHVVAV